MLSEWLFVTTEYIALVATSMSGALVAIGKRPGRKEDPLCPAYLPTWRSRALPGDRRDLTRR